MFHTNRVWSIFPVATPEELVELLAEHVWCGCNGFAIGNYLFVNDATSANGAQEYGVVKKPTQEGEPYVQIESITASWMTHERLLEFICRTLAGENDQMEWARPVEARFQTPQEHGRCHLCA